jgi:hypothetical protein
MNITIETTDIFSHASSIVNSLMPVTYLVAGIGLGFVVVGKIISAFR